MAKLVDLGLIGLGLMGRNLALNLNDHGFRVAVFERTSAKLDEFMAGPAQASGIVPTRSLMELLACLEKPRRIMLMVAAGQPVDDLLKLLTPRLDPGDILIDGGNSLHLDTSLRASALAAQGILYLGVGISGGEEGARSGPAIMPGGNPEAWPWVKNIFQTIAAWVDGEPCCDWIAEGGAGHFVKMVHNGIEYGDMQLICEAYDFMKRGLGLDAEKMQALFAEWNKGALNSYLIEITANILGVKDQDGAPLLSKIVDVAEQKGTGKWTVNNALELGVPLTLIAEAVFARQLSAIREERRKAAAILAGPATTFSGELNEAIAQLHDALYAAKIISYAQGFMLLQAAAKRYSWQLNYGQIAAIWRGGCIIRSALLDQIRQAFASEPSLDNFLLAAFFQEALQKAQVGWRKTLVRALELGIPTPSISAGLAYYDGYRSAYLPANLLQAQRDYFGAHSYQRLDKPRGEFFHTNWR